MVVPTINGPNPRWHIVRLAEIWPPYDPAGSVIAHAAPIDSVETQKIEEQGFTVIAEAPPGGGRWGAAPEGDTPDQRTYTHIISTGTHDYLARLEPTE